MLYYLTAVGLIAHTCFWGLGLALLALPKIWHRWWWVFVPGFGFALQSAVVWAGVHTSMAGTNVYAGWSELIPAILLILVVVEKRWEPARNLWGFLLIGSIAGWLFLSPMTKPGAGLTTSSLGNCDPADYAAGARVFQEFSRDDRIGFLGLPEVTKVKSADYFFDFWVRLNHFTPSALIAFNATIFRVPAFRLVSVMAVAVMLMNLPAAFFLARVTVGLRGVWLLGFLALYAVSPLSAYAVYQGQLGQLYAAQGIVLLTLSVFGGSLVAHAGRSVRTFVPLMFMAFWLLAGSYNFILPVCLAPGGAWLLLQLWQRRDWNAVGRVFLSLITAFGLCVILFWGRFNGLIERFDLFHQYNFGWAVPIFSPEGLLGMLRDSSLHAWPMFVRITLSTAILGLWMAGLIDLWRRQKPRATAALALVLPVMAGWALLVWETQVRANASYDAYKLISVFYPGLLAGLGCWLTAVHRRGCAEKVTALAMLAFVLTANLWVLGHFRRQMANPPLRANRNIAELDFLEKDSQITSLNLVMEDSWNRLWANAFLLRKPQYFPIHTYEGRLNTALKGEWNLSDSLLRSIPLDADDFRQFNVRFYLVRAAARGLLQVGFGDGWYGEERAGPRRWRWSAGRSHILINNPTSVAVHVRLRLLVRSFLARSLNVQFGMEHLAPLSLNGSDQVVEPEIMLLPPGSTLVTLDSEAVSPGGGDNRPLAFALYGLELRTLAMQK